MIVSQLREKCVGTVKAKDGEEELLEQFWAANHYVAGSYDTQGDFQCLNQEMVAVEKGIANRLFYLALPPSVFKPVTSMLKVRMLNFGIRSNLKANKPFSPHKFIINYLILGCLHVPNWLDQSNCGETIWKGFCQLC